MSAPLAAIVTMRSKNSRPPPIEQQTSARTTRLQRVQQIQGGGRRQVDLLGNSTASLKVMTTSIWWAPPITQGRMQFAPFWSHKVFFFGSRPQKQSPPSKKSAQGAAPKHLFYFYPLLADQTTLHSLGPPFANAPAPAPAPPDL